MLPLDDQADVGDIDAHAERICANHPGQLGLQVIAEPLKQVFLLLRAELPMEKRRVQTHEAEIARQLVADLRGRDEDHDLHANPLGDQKQIGDAGGPTAPRYGFAIEADAGPIDPMDKDWCVRSPERREDLSLRVATCRGGERQDGRIAEPCPNLSQPAVIWPEIPDKLRALLTRHREPA
jgi:hypothetical protein